MGFKSGPGPEKTRSVFLDLYSTSQQKISFPASKVNISQTFYVWRGSVIFQTIILKVLMTMYLSNWISNKITKPLTILHTFQICFFTSKQLKMSTERALKK